MNRNVKRVLTHVLAIVVMLVASCIYFAPALRGDIIVQGDMQKGDAMAHQQRMVADSTGTIPNWNPSMFSGMPGYQTAADPQKSVFTPLKSVLIMRPLGLERNVGMLWIYLIGFYVAMLALGCSPWLSLLGSLAFGLGSYNIIIVEAGHIAKGWAMSMMAPMLAGMVLSFKSVMRDEEGRYAVRWRRLVWGVILFTLATGLQITFNHIQITFYTVIAGVVMGLTYLVYSLKEKWFKQFLLVVGVLLVGCVFAIGSNYRHLTVNQEYAKVTMRGGSEISVKPHDLGLEDARQTEATQSGGLDINYAFSWSYGVGETYTLLVPYAMGGASGEKVADDSEWMQLTRMNQAPTYWGDQPFTSGPVYFGAIVVLLFVLGCIVVKGPERWWLIIATVIGVVLAWGRNFMPVNEFLFNHLPLYNKFRTPSMSLVLSNVTMVIMGMLAVKELLEQLGERKQKDGKVQKGDAVADYDRQKRLNRALGWAAGIVGGIVLVGMLVGATKLTFSSPDNDEGLKTQYLSSLRNQGVNEQQIAQWEQAMWPQMHEALKQERKSMYMHDSWRSLVLVLLAAGLMWLYINGKMKKGWLIGLLTVLTVVDLWGVDRRYLNEDNFVAPERLALHRTPSEQLLDRTAQQNGDRDYRVYDLTVNTFNDSRPSAFHNEIGGYSAAKLRRYQDLIDFYLGSTKFYDYLSSLRVGVIANDGEMRLGVQEPYPVLDMLNCRYLMHPMQGATPVRRQTALGNCWLVEEVRFVEDPNAEIVALNDFEPGRTAIVDRSQWPEVEKELKGTQINPDSSEGIVLVHTYPQTPDHLTYKSHTNGSRIVVFSEIYYAPDWRAYIDGKPADYFRADYVLRAMIVPAGDHTIEFVNEAPTLHRHDRITLIISLLMLAAMGGALFLVYRKRKN